MGLTTADWLRLRRLLLGTTGEAAERGGGQLVILGDFLSELQALRRGQRRTGDKTARSRNTPEVYEYAWTNKAKFAINN